jgi:DNA repair protein RadD
VDSVRYYKHEKPGSPASLRVEYLCGMTLHRSWQCFNHKGFARSKAESWWRQSARSVVPKDTDEALRRVAELATPTEIQVRPDGKYFSVVGIRFAQKEKAA